MPRKDRLADLIRDLRRPGPHRAADLARRHGVTLRTIYRDLDTLRAAGLPVAGTRGRGYRITAEVTLPPLNLTLDELEALHLGLVAVASGGDPALAAAAVRLADRLDRALPEDGPADPRAEVLSFTTTAPGTRHQAALRQAVRARQKLSLRIGGRDRTVRPLRLDYWGRLWTCVVWCETTDRFDEIRLDAIETVTPLPALFGREPGRELPDFDALRGGG